jgi:Sec-independent protein translocase protein TatA
MGTSLSNMGSQGSGILFCLLLLGSKRMEEMMEEQASTMKRMMENQAEAMRLAREDQIKAREEQAEEIKQAREDQAKAREEQGKVNAALLGFLQKKG